MNFTINQKEIAEIEVALYKAEAEGNLNPNKHKSFFLGFVGEKLVEKALGIKFCDMSFDKELDDYAHADIPQYNLGVKTLRNMSDTIWMNSDDMTHDQIVVFVSYNKQKKCWVMEEMFYVLPETLVKVGEPVNGRTPYSLMYMDDPCPDCFAFQLAELIDDDDMIYTLRRLPEKNLVNGYRHMVKDPDHYGYVDMYGEKGTKTVSDYWFRYEYWNWKEDFVSEITYNRTIYHCTGNDD